MMQIKHLYILIDRFHAALPVSDNRILVSGGCSAIGALQDVHIFNTGEQVFCFFVFFFSIIGFKKYGVFVPVQSSVAILHEASILMKSAAF